MFGWLRAASDHAHLAVVGSEGEAGGSLDAVAGVAQRAEDEDEAGRGVERDRVADAAALGWIGGQHERDALVGGRDSTEPGETGGHAGEALDAVGHGTVRREADAEVVAVVDHLRERERRSDDPTVQLGDGDAERDVER